MPQDFTAPARPSHSPFRVAFVPGVTPGKWTRIWDERMRPVPIEVTPVEVSDQLAVLYDGRADMCFVRLPVARDDLSVIPLYFETPVVMVPTDHPVTAVDEVSVADLADEHLLQNPDDVPEWRDVADELRHGTRFPVPEMSLKDAVATVAAGTGILIVPKSVARLHDRKDVEHRPVRDVAESQIGLAWLAGAGDEHTDSFIGIVRGRTAHSSRSGTPPQARQEKPAASKEPPGSSAAKKTPIRGQSPRGGARRRGGQ